MHVVTNKTVVSKSGRGWVGQNAYNFINFVSFHGMKIIFSFEVQVFVFKHIIKCKCNSL